MNEKTGQSIRNVQQALSRLKEALETPEDEQSSLLVDGTIQRFEFCIELFWKLLRRVLLESGIETGTPREAIQKAYQARWIEDESLWIQMLRDRNQTSHTYEEDLAIEIFRRIPDYYVLMTQALDNLQDKV